VDAVSTVCGWCARITDSRATCTHCGHVDPDRPFVQRGLDVPEVHPQEAGRPPLTADEMRRRLEALGADATVEQLAERWEVDPRTIRRWRQKVSA